MSNLLTRSLAKLSTSTNILPALSTNLAKRSFTRTTPNQFFFGKKPSFEIKKVQIPNASWKKGTVQKIPSGKTIQYEPKEMNNMLRFALGTVS